MSAYGEFIRASSYSRAVDRKKLAFLYTHAVAEAGRTGRSCREMRVVDLGAAAGALTLPLATLFGHVDAVDIDAAALERLRARAEKAGYRNVTAFERDAAAFDAASPYDVVLASEVLNNVADPAAFLANAASLLRPGGLLLATVANGYGAFELRNRHLNVRAHVARLDWIRRALGKAPHRAPAGGYALHFFTYRQLMDRFRAQGFDVIETRNADWLLPLVRSLRHERLAELDCLAADRVPAGMASGWYFALRGATSHNATERTGGS